MAKSANAVRCCFSPFENILALLNIQPREYWESIREIRRGLTTFKTGQKLFTNELALQSVSAMKKHLGQLPAPPRAIQLMRHQFSNGYSTPEAVMWLSLLETPQFSNPTVLAYWEERLYQVSDFCRIELRSSPQLLSRLTTYNSAQIVASLGRPEARTVLTRILPDLKSDDEIESSRELKTAYAADFYSTLLRLSAWLNAEAQTENWEWEVNEGTHNTIHAAWAGTALFERYHQESADTGGESGGRG